MRPSRRDACQDLQPAQAFWIILAATSNHAEDLTGVVGVASIQRHYNVNTVIEVTVGMLRWERQNR